MATTVNGRDYNFSTGPVVVVCIDGCADEYLTAGLVRDRLPYCKQLMASGFYGLARAAIPTFTNVNNSAIVAGVSPEVTGISGNFFLDPGTGEEVMMNSAEFLRCGTILQAAAEAGRKVGVVTAKEKLRSILSHGWQGVAFSSEKVKEAAESTHGISDVESLIGSPAPEIYSGDASVYVLEAGAYLLASGRCDFLYLSLTDFMQHKFAPEEEESLAFYEQLDHWIGQLVSLGARVGLTADHGMNAKNGPDGSPNVLFLESRLSEQFGNHFKVICPITDPYVVHHGALGSYVCVHIEGSTAHQDVAQFLKDLPGITEVYLREEASQRLELPADRIGDIVALSGRDVVLGRRPEDHDLSHVANGLRSHGGRYEEMVPFIVSGRLQPEYAARAAGDLRNFDIFDFVCNGIADE